MDKFVITGGGPLRGAVEAGGSKNSALPILAATLLSTGRCVIRRVPDLRDVRTMIGILQELGVRVTRDGDGTVTTWVEDESNVTARYELVSTMRASICVLGPLLARRKKARVSLPGGCVIGVRPIDLHLKGLAALGADIRVEHGYVEAAAGGLRGSEIFLGGAFGSSVTGTANVLMASVLCSGRAVIENAACEPEVRDLAEFLVAMGARIGGIGSPRLVVEGVDELHGAEHSVIPDRIETGTFLLAGAITGGEVTVRRTAPGDLAALRSKLAEVGAEVSFTDDTCTVRGPETIRPTDITTLPYPGFPTDLQAQFTALLTRAEGISVVTEKIYPDRFMHVAELARMGADIRKEGPNAIIHGVPRLSGAPVMASDLRASAALVLAGLVAEGTTEISRVYHIDRGYERIAEKLRALGADIERVPDKKGGEPPAEG